MAKIALFPPNYRLLNTTGQLMTDGALIYTYAATTSTPIATYSDASGGTTLANPYVVPSTGLVDMWVTPGTSYRLLVKTSSGATLHDVDNVVGILKQSDITTLGNIATGTITASGTISGTAVSMSGNITSGGILAGASAAITGAITAATVTTTGAVTATAVNATVEDSRTTTVATPVTITATTSGTPAAGIGTGILIKAESADENPCSLGQIDFRATDVTAGSEDTEFVISNRVAGAALAPAYKLRSTGAGNYIFTGAPTVARTITLPDTDLTLSGVTSPYVFISSNVLAAPTSSVQFTNLSATYSEYILVISNLVPSTNLVSLLLRLGTDNVTPIVTNYSYCTAVVNSAAGAGVDGGGPAATSILMGVTYPNTATAAHAGTIRIINPMLATEYTSVVMDTVAYDGTNIQRRSGAGRYNVAAATNLINISYSSGNIATGSFYLYGLRTS